MKSFRSLVVLKRPQHEMWEIMRDHMVEFAGQIADIQEVREVSRVAGPNGQVHIVNEWRARQEVPAALRSMLKIEEICWIDRNVWDATTGICSWTIEPTFLREHLACSGETAFAEAMAGRGTRITFSGELDLKPGALGALGSMETMVAGFLESVVSTVIPRNLRSVAEAAAAFEPRG